MLFSFWDKTYSTLIACMGNLTEFKSLDERWKWLCAYPASQRLRGQRRLIIRSGNSLGLWAILPHTWTITSPGTATVILPAWRRRSRPRDYAPRLSSIVFLRPLWTLRARNEDPESEERRPREQGLRRRIRDARPFIRGYHDFYAWRRILGLFPRPELVPSRSSITFAQNTGQSAQASPRTRSPSLPSSTPILARMDNPEASTLTLRSSAPSWPSWMSPRRSFRSMNATSYSRSELGTDLP